MSAQLGLDGFISAPAWRQVAKTEDVLLRVCQNAEQLRYVSVDWMRKNWRIWEHFEREADLLWRHGHRRWGARTIGEHIRRQTLLREKDAVFKVNDHIWPDLARLYLILNPERECFFELRGREDLTTRSG